MKRERGFNYNTKSADDEYIIQKKISLEQEKKLASKASFGPKDVPRFQHPDNKKLMAAVKSDMKLLNFSNSANQMGQNGPESTEEYEQFQQNQSQAILEA